MLLKVDGVELQFFPVHLHFDNEVQKNLFGHKNNKALRETLEHQRYKKFKELCYQNYNSLLDFPLGDFLLELKNNDDSNYKLFLNKYGDVSYSHFWIDDETVLNKKGLYCYCIGDEVKYIGRCLDSFRKRINQGYGKIHPKNCYIDGQATNCHLNSRITGNINDVSLWICQLEDEYKIIQFELRLIEQYCPDWNIIKNK